jgi:putative nucleotidyltransferase with HDIG domain
MSFDPDSLVNDSSKIPSLPLIYQEITSAIDDPSSSTSMIGEVISKDSGLSVRLLRIANSSLYNFPSTVDTVSQAIIVIGIQQIRDLALGTMVIEMFDGISPELVDMNSFWRHSLACGIAARVLASHRREANVERFLVAGVLHDIGRLILYMKVPDQAKEALVRSKDKGELLYKIEREIFGFDHGEVGGALLRHWKLPPNLMDAVNFHHTPQKAKKPSDPCIVHVADIMTNAMRLGSSGEHFVPPLQLGCWEKLDLPKDVILSTMKEVDRSFQNTVDMFLQNVGQNA